MHPDRSPEAVVKPSGRSLRINITTGPFYPSPPAPCGAVERIWFDLARTFVARGHTVTLFSRGYSGFGDETIDGVQIRRFWTFKQTSRIYVDLIKDLVFSSRIAAALTPADITITNSFFLPILVPRLARRAGKVYVAVHRMPKGQMGLYLSAARLQAVSSAVKQQIAEQTPEAGDIARTIPNPINTQAFTPDASVIPDSPPRILYAGRIHPEKGLHILARAYALLRDRGRDVTLRLRGASTIDTGGAGNSYIAALRALSAPYPIEVEPSIYERNALADELRRATVFCYPSVAETGETFGVSTVEAMAVGTVPVVSDLQVFRDYLVPGINGLSFNHRSPNAHQLLADSIESLLLDPLLRRRLAAAAAVTATGFSIDSVANLFLADFQTIMESPRGDR